MAYRHREFHKLENIGWLRAAVLGANDGIVSTSSLILGVAAAHATHSSIVITGMAGLVAGAMSMATGEYISVQSQADTEQAALATERTEPESDMPSEHRELASIYVDRGLDASLAQQVATQLMAHDALAAHARDELGITDILSAKPVQAAFASAISFALGGLMPLLVVVFAPVDQLILFVGIGSLLFLAILGGLAARIGGANITKGIIRVTFWSALAMGVTAAIGSIFGTLS
ncbi:MAG: VIT family protein [Undibacterium umbellatum]|uniref:VIT1/CCC1 transporter family protein n=1 Tax=Undibacterium umbellatum TaxID=2762300 RepID=UPI003BB7911B